MLGIGTMRRIAGEVRRDVRAAYERDPAAKNVSATEVLAAWPGVHALLSHRVAHALDAAGVPIAPRVLAYCSRSLTGIEIHPAAKIADGLFIDHGMGVVIGETAEVGEDVTIYQGVTLGGTGFATGKRHPMCRRTRRSWATPGIPCASRVASPRARTPTGSTCPTRSPTRSSSSRAASRSSRPRSPRCAARRPTTRPRSSRCAPSAAPIPPVASFSHTVEIPRPPDEVFPWLLEEDKVPRWTSHLESYTALDGALTTGSRVRQVLEVSGRRIDVELELTEYDPPTGAETRFSTNGIEVINAYALEPAGAGTRLTQSVDAKPSGLTARMLVPVIQPRLEEKLTQDLERLRVELSA
jgi:serine O-acetyltransferase